MAPRPTPSSPTLASSAERRRSRSADDLKGALAAVADAEVAVGQRRFFKTGPGEYGEGDVFLGVRVPQVRAVVRAYPDLPLDQIRTLLDSPVHEHRLAGLLVLNARAASAGAPRTRDDAALAQYADFYLAAVRDGRVNNWDLVDCSAEIVLGGYLYDRPRELLVELAASPELWQRRVAVLTTFAFLKRGDASTTLELALRLLDDPEDLMRKAVGWMLRETGKRVDPALLTGFLDRHAGAMPRTMLSYATEHLTPTLRAHYRGLPRY